MAGRAGVENDYKLRFYELLRDKLCPLPEGTMSFTEVAHRIGSNRKTVANWLPADVRNQKFPDGSQAAAVRGSLVALARECLGPGVADELDLLFDQALGIRAVKQSRRAAAESYERAREIGLTPGVPTRANLELRQALHGVETGGPIPSLTERFTDESDHGYARRWLFRSSITAGDVPPYVERDIDVELKARLTGKPTTDSAAEGSFAPVVIVAGPPKAGKTRTLLEVARQQPDLPMPGRHFWPSLHFGHRELHEPRRPGTGDPLSDYARALSRIIAAARANRKNHGDHAGRAGAETALVFIDDLQDFFVDPTDGRIHNAQVVTNLQAISKLGVPVIATCHDYVLAGDPAAFGLTTAAQGWLTEHSVRLAIALTPNEETRARHILTDHPDLARFAVVLADYEALSQRALQPRGVPTAQNLARRYLLDSLTLATLIRGPRHVQDLLDAARARAGPRLGTPPNRDRLLREAVDWLVTPPNTSTHQAIACYGDGTAAGEMTLSDVISGVLISGCAIPIDSEITTVNLVRAAESLMRVNDLGGAASCALRVAQRNDSQVADMLRAATIQRLSGRELEAVVTSLRIMARRDALPREIERTSKLLHTIGAHQLAKTAALRIPHDPESGPDQRLGAAIALLRSGSTDEAAQVAYDTAQRAGVTPRVLKVAANVLWKARRPDEAATVTLSLAEHPRSTVGQADGAAQRLLKAARADAAAQAAARVAGHEHSAPHQLVGALKVLLATDRTDEALVVARRITKHRASSPRRLLAVVQMLQAADLGDDAAVTARVVARHQLSERRHVEGAATALLAVDSTEAVRTALEILADLDGDCQEEQLAVAVTLWRSGRTDDALTAARQFSQRGSRNGDGASRMTRLQRRIEVAAAARRLSEEHDATPSQLLHAASALRKAGLNEDAAATAHRIIEHHNARPHDLLGAASVLRKVGLDEDAAAAAQLIIEHHNARPHDLLGAASVLRKVGLDEDAGGARQLSTSPRR